MAERLEDEDLRERVRQVLLGADDVGDPHLGVVDDRGEVVERLPAGPDDHEVADLVGLLLDVPLDQVVDDEPSARAARGTGARTAVPRRRTGRPRSAVGRLRRGTGRRPWRRRPPSSSGGALGLGAVVAIDVPAGDQAIGGRRGTFSARSRLEIGPERAADLGAFVPVHPHPAEAVEDLLDGLLDVALLVGVVDPEDELAAVVAGEEPVEEGRPDPPDVEEAGRAGGEPRAYAHDVGRPCLGRNRLPTNELGPR